MKLKKLWIVLAVCLIVCCLILASKVVYVGKGVTVTVVEPKEEPAVTSGHKVHLTEEMAFTENPIIVTGTVTNVREVKVVYKNSYGETETLYLTLFDFQVSEYLKNTSATIGDKKTLTIGYPSSSYDWCKECPVIESGKEMLVFCIVPAEYAPDNPIQYHKFMDCIVAHTSRLALEIEDGKYLLNDFIREDMSITETDKAAFENEIKEKIQKYCGESGQ